MIFVLWGLLPAAVLGKNVVYVMLDDFGWGDFGIHGSRLSTPNLDALASSGVVLDGYYTQPVCSPTRSALLTGRYPIRLGLQHNVILAGQESGIPKEYKLLPEELKECGFETHMVGKWHAGHAHEFMLPFRRGFDTFFGYLQGAEDHYSRVQCQGKNWCGIDFATENGPTNATFGTYGTEIYSHQVASVLDRVKNDPFFIYYALQNVHYPLQAPEHYKIQFDWIKDESRRNYAAMVSIMDEAIGDLVQMLKQRGLWEDTLLIVTADNGGETRSGGNNFPLRSQKWSLYEGGVRANAFIAGGLAPMKDAKFDGLFHVSDWRDTILDAMSCPRMKDDTKRDGMSQWDALRGKSPSPRFSLLHNIDPLKRAKGKDDRAWLNEVADVVGFDLNAQSALRFGEWKILTGDPAQGVPDGNIPPPEANTGKKLTFSPLHRTTDEYWARDLKDNFFKPSKKLKRLVQLFNIRSDPYEKEDVSDEHVDLVRLGLSLLSFHNETAVPPQWPKIDPASMPDSRTGSLRGFWWPWKG